MFIQNNCQFLSQNIGNRVKWVLVPLYTYTHTTAGHTYGYHLENLSSKAIGIIKIT